ncbi:MAG: thiamine pyrophosphate-dependent enzyme [Spirochaetia bacterium]
MKNTDELLELYRYMVTAREMDLIEEEYTGRGEAFFHVSGAGHEASVMLAPFLEDRDRLHCHYRDKALMLARGISPEMFFLSLFNKHGSHSRGRQMNAHMSAPELGILSLVGPVGNSALQAAGVAEVLKEMDPGAVVLCSLGDGMSQQGEVLEAVAQCVRDELPVLFLIQDNAFAISTKTEGKTFYRTPSGKQDMFYTVPITWIDGRHPLEAEKAFGPVVQTVRKKSLPAIAVMEADRLSNHTNADDQRMYRTPEEIKHVKETGDPIIRFQHILEEQGISPGELADLADGIREELRNTVREVQRMKEPEPVHTAVRPIPEKLTAPESEFRGETGGDDGLTMLEALRETLRHRLSADSRVQLYGEDIEDPKGDVFGVTRGLSSDFPGRVKNSPLAEATIVGTAVGQALAGKRPVAFLQFADFLPIAYNQIFAELGSMYWRTDGGWQAPVILMVTCGGYRPGLGPFHASSMEGIAAHTPGVDVFMPSTAGDAAGLLNAAFESGRPAIFFYPKNCLNDRRELTGRDVARNLIPIGRARVVREGEHVTLVGWGNTVSLCLKAAESLALSGAEAEVIDLRSIVPWDSELVTKSAEKTGRLIVVHEDNHTAGMGAEVIAKVTESSTVPVTARRVTRGDTYVPCNFANQLEVLPSYRRILETAVDLLGGTIVWKKTGGDREGLHTVEAIGTSPSDESVTVISWSIRPGDTIEEGQLIAEMEADKAAFDFRSPVEGTVTELHCEEGDTVKVGTPVFTVKSTEGAVNLKPVTREEPGEPVITGIETEKPDRKRRNTAPAVSPVSGLTAGIAEITYKTGTRLVKNEEISALCPTWSPEDIYKRTGIKTRQWVTGDEDAFSLAADAVTELFIKTGTTMEDIDMILCSTGTPLYTTPSMAAMLHNKFQKRGSKRDTAAMDITAACSGYLYGLQIAYDYLAGKPDHRILLVTTEVLSTRLDTSDPATAPIFGDAATASLIVGAGKSPGARFRVHRPVLSAKGEPAEALVVPAGSTEPVTMDGPKVFQQAVRAMVRMLREACTEAAITPEKLALVVPHQANQRIINSVRQRLKTDKEKVFSNIDSFGNTSSSTIPICLSQIKERVSTKDMVGLTAFGGGYTFGGGILEVL